MKKVEVLKEGKRIDGRDFLEMREIDVKLDVISRADGSAKFSFGNTVAIAACYGPRLLLPKHLQEEKEGIIRFRYNMAPFSVDERKSPGPDRRSIELSKVIKEALACSVFLEDFPRATLDVYVEILNADGSTRIASTNAASLAMASAGVPMRDLVCAVSVGKIDNTLIVDLNGIEDNNSEADLSFGMLPTKDEVVLLQMDGRLTKAELLKLLDLAKENCLKIYELQKRVLKGKYGVENVE